MSHFPTFNGFRYLSKILLQGILTILILVLVGCNMPQSAPTQTPIEAPPSASEEPQTESAVPTAVEETPIAQKNEPAVELQPQVTSQVVLPQVETSGQSAAAETAPAEALPTEAPAADAAAAADAAPAANAAATEMPAATGEPEQPAVVEPATAPTLAFVSGNNIFLVEPPAGTPRQITSSGDLLSFAWAPDGSKLATYNGKLLCFLFPDGTAGADCVDLQLDENQAKIERRLVWSPDQKRIVLWNPINPWETGALGWIIVALDGSKEIIQIEDPVDWGLKLSSADEPGGITGQALFLGDGTLVGTFTHSSFCGSGGCHYQLYQFDFATSTFQAYANKPEEGFSEGLHLKLSNDSTVLVNYGIFNSGCENYLTFIDFYQLDSQTRTLYNLDQEAVSGMTLSPDMLFGVIARSASCSDPNQVTWASTCGLTSGLEVYPMQVWDFASNTRTDLLPGASPAWAPTGEWLAFNTCMSTNAAGGWEVNETASPGIFIRSFVDGAVYKLADGSLPAWRP